MKNKKLIVRSVMLSIFFITGIFFLVYEYVVNDDNTLEEEYVKDTINDENTSEEEHVKEAINSYNENPVALSDMPIYSDDTSNFYKTDLSIQKKPKKLLVLLFQYTGNPYFAEGTDEETAKIWGDYIFGSGSIEEGTASINDYFKEISNGEFYFEPVLLGNNTSGVYNIELDKSYSDMQFIHEDYPYFDFQVDIAKAIDELANQGLDISSFSAPYINNSNYQKIMVELWDSNQSEHLKEWYMTDTVLCIFPPVNVESVSFTPISTDYDHFNIYAHINYDSSFGTIVHELIHTLGAIDVYNFGAFGGDIMSSYYPQIPSDFNTMHLNPYYKMLYGWADVKVLTNSASVILYPATSDKYNPIIVKTNDNGQYFIIENRTDEGFDHGVFIDDSDCINIWRVDKLGMEAIYDDNRKGIIAEKLNIKGQSKEMKYYKNSNDIKDVTLESSGVRIEYVASNEDGSIVVNIYQ